MRSRSLDDTEQLRMSSEIGYNIGRRVVMTGLGRVVQTAKDHLHGDGVKWLLQRFGHAVSEVHQHRIEQPGRPQLQLDRVLRPAPEIGQAQQSLDNQKGVFTIPSLMPL